MCWKRRMKLGKKDEGIGGGCGVLYRMDRVAFLMEWCLGGSSIGMRDFNCLYFGRVFEIEGIVGIEFEWSWFGVFIIVRRFACLE